MQYTDTATLGNKVLRPVQVSVRWEEYKEENETLGLLVLLLISMSYMGAAGLSVVWPYMSPQTPTKPDEVCFYFLFYSVDSIIP